LNFGICFPISLGQTKKVLKFGIIFFDFFMLIEKKIVLDFFMSIGKSLLEAIAIKWIKFDQPIIANWV